LRSPGLGRRRPGCRIEGSVPNAATDGASGLYEFGSGEFCDLLVDGGLVQRCEYQGATASRCEVGVGHRPDTTVDERAPFTVAGGHTPGTAQLAVTASTNSGGHRRARRRARS
jgi:hypothetical protein